MGNDGLICWSCGKPTGFKHKVGRNDECDQCLAQMRCCRGCRHFDPTRRWQCRENIDTFVKNKETANFCDFFQMRDAIKGPGGTSAQIETKDTRRQSFDDLFKD